MLSEERAGWTSSDIATDPLSSQPPSVIIFGPPWSRSGTARVIQSQIKYYRERGFFTVFIVVPFFWYHVGQDPNEMTEGMDELGADRLFPATLDQKSYTVAKYKASIRHCFRGTVLDWQVAIGKAARLPDESVKFLTQLRAVLLHVNHVYTLGFAMSLRRRLSGGRSLPIILETQDIQSHLLENRGDLNPWTDRPDPLDRLIKSERELLEKADTLIHLSVDDFEFFQRLLPSKPQFLALPIIAEDICSTVSAAAPLAERIDLLFLGHCHRPNLFALKWFFDQVWPLIANHQYNLKIVGLIGSLVQRELPQLYETFRSCFVGEVADLGPYYRSARCVIAPMVSGTGVSIKTIEALTLGKPFVGTSKAFRGLPMDRLRATGTQAYDDPQAFADAIAQALGNEAAAQLRSRAAYERIFSAQAFAESRDKASRAAISAHESTSWLRKATAGAMRRLQAINGHSRAPRS